MEECSRNQLAFHIPPPAPVLYNNAFFSVLRKDGRAYAQNKTRAYYYAIRFSAEEPSPAAISPQPDYSRLIFSAFSIDFSASRLACFTLLLLLLLFYIIFCYGKAAQDSSFQPFFSC